MASDAAPGVEVQDNEALGVRVEIGCLGDMSAPIIGGVLGGVTQEHGIWHGTLPQGDNPPFGRMLVSWFGRLKPLEKLWLIHDIPFAVLPLEPGCFWCVIFLAGSVDGISFPAGTLLYRQRKERPLPVKGEVESVISREENRRYRAVRLRDDPEPGAVPSVIRRNDPRALDQCLVVGLTVVLCEVAPIAGLVPLNP
jgi:hypothetical protein